MQVAVVCFGNTLGPCQCALHGVYRVAQKKSEYVARKSRSLLASRAVHGLSFNFVQWTDWRERLILELCIMIEWRQYIFIGLTWWGRRGGGGEGERGIDVLSLGAPSRL